jgi:cystathionine gamma-lyase
MNDIYTNVVNSPTYSALPLIQEEPESIASQKYSQILISKTGLSGLEQSYATLEQTPYAVAFDSYASTVKTLLFTLLYKNDNLLVFNDIHSTTRILLNKFASEYSIDIKYIDYKENVILERYFTSTTRILWFESPGELFYHSYDIEKITRIAHQNNVLVIVGNSLLTPYFQNPALLNADIVIHDISRYISTHSKVKGGAIMLRDGGWYGRLKYNQAVLKLAPSAFDRYITLRGIRNLEKHLLKRQANATSLLLFLKTHPKIGNVFFINNNGEILGGVLSFLLKGSVNEVNSIIERLSFGILEENFAGSETRISLPALETDNEGNALWAEAPFNLVKVSLGTEEADAIIEEFKKGFELISIL